MKGYYNKKHTQEQTDMRKIAAQYIFPVDSEPVKNGYVVIDDDGTVMETGVLESESASTEFYNGILIPGMVNTHCHIELSHLKGCFRQASGMAGFIKQINELRLNCDEKSRKTAIEENMKLLYMQGVSAMADISNCDESFEIKSGSPIYTRTFLEVFGTEDKDVEEIIRNVKSLNEKAENFGIDAAPTPHACYTSSKRLIATVSELGLESGFLSYHSEESDEEMDMIRYGTGALSEDYRSRKLSTPEVYGKNPLVYYIDALKERTGTPVEGNILLVHNTFTDSDSIEYAKKHLKSPFWALCPRSNIFINRALPPVNLMMAHGLKLTIGTDSLSSNTSLDMISEMYTIQKYFTTVPLEEIIKWSTLNGAEFLKKDEIAGSLTPGKKPGLVLVENIDWKNMRLTEKSRSVRLV